MSIANRLLDDFNSYRDQTAHIRKLRASGQYLRSYAHSEKNLRYMEALESWCGERQIQPRLWLYTLFEARRWMYAPDIAKLCSESHLKRYASVKYPTRFFSDRVIQPEIQAARGAEAYDPRRDLSGTTEALKRKYLMMGHPNVCLDDMMHTLGFHPRSTVCARCSLAPTCEQKLRASVTYDIVAYRRGEAPVVNAWVTAHDCR